MDALPKETSLARRLLSDFSDIVSDDEDAASDMIEGETDLHGILDWYVQKIVENEQHVKSIKDHRQALFARQERLAQRAKRFRERITFTLQELGLNKPLQLPTATLSLSSGAQSVVVDDAKLLPGDLVKQQDPKPILAEIKKRLKDGDAVPGAHLERNPASVSIRGA